MNHRFEVELPSTLTDEEARLVIDVLESLIDGLCRQVHQLDRQVRGSDERWSVPEWMNAPADKE